jgi:acetoin utilization protein AcuB
MRLEQVMTNSGLVTVRPDDTLDIAAQTMLWSEVAHLPVVEDGRVVGMLAERDLIGRPLDGSMTVAEVMTAPAVVAGPDDDLDTAIAEMTARRIGCLPVVDDGKLVGIVTAGDVLSFSLKRPRSPRVSSLVRRMVASVRAEDLLVDAVARMRKLGVRHLPVTDGDNKLVGMLSDRDVRTAVGNASVDGSVPARVRAMKVDDVMSRDPIRVSADMELEELTRILVKSRVGAVPVVDADGRLAGIVSYVDALRATLEEDLPLLSEEATPRPAGT